MGVREVLIFGDCDPKFGGQAAAFALAHKLTSRHGLTARVLIPPETGTDWTDHSEDVIRSDRRDAAE